MLKPRLLLTAGVVAASVAAGTVGGALLFTPASSGAQDGTATTTTAPDPGRMRGPGFGGFRGGSLEVAAEALGMDESALREALRGGKTIADVAKETNVDLQTVIDALVADAKDKLQQLEADLPQRMSDFVNKKAPAGPDHFRHGPRGGPFMGAGLDAAATALGMDESALREALRGGKTIADVAKEKNVDLQTVIDALVDVANDKIDQAVADGRISSDRADEMKSHTKDMITAFVNGQMPSRPDGAWGGPPPPPTDA
jgi:hypothetical protein